MSNFFKELNEINKEKYEYMKKDFKLLTTEQAEELKDKIWPSELNKIQAVGEYVYLIKDAPITKRGGLDIPEISVKKPNTGKILSVGNLVQDKNIRKGKTAIFSKQVGSEIEIFDTEITVLNGNNQISGIY